MVDLLSPTTDAAKDSQEGPVSVEGPRSAGQLCLDDAAKAVAVCKGSARDKARAALGAFLRYRAFQGDALPDSLRSYLANGIGVKHPHDFTECDLRVMEVIRFLDELREATR